MFTGRAGTMNLGNKPENPVRSTLQAMRERSKFEGTDLMCFQEVSAKALRVLADGLPGNWECEPGNSSGGVDAVVCWRTDKWKQVDTRMHHKFEIEWTKHPLFSEVRELPRQSHPSEAWGHLRLKAVHLTSPPSTSTRLEPCSSEVVLASMHLQNQGTFTERGNYIKTTVNFYGFYAIKKQVQVIIGGDFNQDLQVVINAFAQTSHPDYTVEICFPTAQQRTDARCSTRFPIDGFIIITPRAIGIHSKGLVPNQLRFPKDQTNENILVDVWGRHTEMAAGDERMYDHSPVFIRYNFHSVVDILRRRIVLMEEHFRLMQEEIKQLKESFPARSNRRALALPEHVAHQPQPVVTILETLAEREVVVNGQHDAGGEHAGTQTPLRRRAAPNSPTHPSPASGAGPPGNRRRKRERTFPDELPNDASLEECAITLYDLPNDSLGKGDKGLGKILNEVSRDNGLGGYTSGIKAFSATKETGVYNGRKKWDDDMTKALGEDPGRNPRDQVRFLAENLSPALQDKLLRLIRKVYAENLKVLKEQGQLE